MSKSYEDLKGIEKVALFIMVLKTETSAKILQVMNGDEVEAVSKAIANLGAISNEVVEKVLMEFLSVFEQNSGVIGNLSVTKELLSKALDEEKAQSIIENITNNVWDKFKKLDVETLSRYLNNESSEVIAVLIANLNNLDLISEIFSMIPEKKAAEVIVNLLSSGELKNEILNNIEETLSKQFSSTTNKQSLFVVEIFNNLDMSLEKKLIDQLSSIDAKFADYVKGKLFKFSDIVKINDIGIQLIVKEIDKEDLKVALRYSEDNIKSILKANISERVFRIIESEMEGASEVAEDQRKKAMNRIAAVARKLMSDKKIFLKESSNK